MGMKKLLSIISALSMSVLLIGCGSKVTTEEGGSGDQKTVGIALPTKSSQRWIDDGDNMKEQFEAMGYKVDMQYAEDVVENQVSQIENMITIKIHVFIY